MHVKLMSSTEVRKSCSKQTAFEERMPQALWQEEDFSCPPLTARQALLNPSDALPIGPFQQPFKVGIVIIPIVQVGRWKMR